MYSGEIPHLRRWRMIVQSAGRNQIGEGNSPKVTKIILKNMNMIGFDLKKKSIRTVFTLFCVHVNFLLTTLMFGYLTFQLQTFFSTLLTLVSWLNALVHLVSIYHSYFYKSKLLSLFNILCNLPQSRQRNHYYININRINIAVIWFQVTIVLSISVYVAFVEKGSMLSTFKEFPFLNGLHLTHLRILYICHMVFFFLFSYASGYLLIQLYCSVCKQCTSSFAAFCERYAGYEITSKQGINFARTKYNELCKIVSEVDRIYSPLVFFWISNLSFNILFYFCSMFKAPLGWHSVLIHVLHIMNCFYLLISICFSGSTVSSIQLTISNLFYEYTNKCIDPSLEIKAQSLYLHSLHQPPHFTAGSTIYVDRNLFLSIGSFILTYVTIVYNIK